MTKTGLGRQTPSGMKISQPCSLTLQSADIGHCFDFFLICYLRFPPRWCFHLIVVRRFEYASDPESYTSGSVATGRASLGGQVEG